MKVLVNAISIIEGGGLVVLKNVLASMNNIRLQATWYVAAHPNIISQLPQSPQIVGLPFAWAKKTPLHHLFWYEFVLTKLIKKNKINIFFSLTNFLPRRPLSCPSVLLVQHAGYFSDQFTQLYLQEYRSFIARIQWNQKLKWLSRSIVNATKITVQTNALANKISEKIKLPEQKIAVIPHGLGMFYEQAECKAYPTTNVWRIGYITKFGVQKDFVTAIKMLSLLKIKNIPSKLILTLNENTHEYAKIKNLIKSFDVEEHIENHGEVSDFNHLKQIYHSLHIFIFPSLCESFGFTLLEAMAMSLPIIAADTPSNREIVGTSGLVQPENAYELVNKVLVLIQDKNLYLQSSKNSFERAKLFSWHKTANNMLEMMDQLIS